MRVRTAAKLSTTEDIGEWSVRVRAAAGLWRVHSYKSAEQMSAARENGERRVRARAEQMSTAKDIGERCMPAGAELSAARESGERRVRARAEQMSTAKDIGERRVRAEPNNCPPPRRLKDGACVH
jgi:hypothetical protein